MPAVPRIDKEKACLLIVDHQVGLFQIVKDIRPIEFRSNMLAHAELGVIWDLPTVMTTSTETGLSYSSFPCLLCIDETR